MVLCYDRQNNDLLKSLSSKVSNLKSVTIDIHDNARDQDTLDHAVSSLAWWIFACLRQG